MAMFTGRPLSAFVPRWPGSRRSAASCFDHRKGGALAEARKNVKRVHTQVTDLERSCEWHELDERHPTKRTVSGFFNAVRRHEKALTGYSEEDVEAMDSLERETNHLVEEVGTLYAIDPALFQARVGVSLLAGVRGLDSKEAFAQYLADLRKVAEDRRERAAWLKKRRDEGYTDAKGVERSPAELAARAERDAARRADPMASRLSATGQGPQDEASTRRSMLLRREGHERARLRDPNRLRDAIDAAHKARNALPPPRGARRSVHGYRVQSHIAGELENPATWDLTEITLRVAEYRERNGVPERPPSETKKYVHEVDFGWRVEPPVAVLRKLRVKDTFTTTRRGPASSWKRPRPTWSLKSSWLRRRRTTSARR